MLSNLAHIINAPNARFRFQKYCFFSKLHRLKSQTG